VIVKISQTPDARIQIPTALRPHDNNDTATKWRMAHAIATAARPLLSTAWRWLCSHWTLHSVVHTETDFSCTPALASPAAANIASMACGGPRHWLPRHLGFSLDRRQPQDNHTTSVPPLLNLTPPPRHPLTGSHDEQSVGLTLSSGRRIDSRPVASAAPNFRRYLRRWFVFRPWLYAKRASRRRVTGALGVGFGDFRPLVQRPIDAQREC